MAGNSRPRSHRQVLWGLAIGGFGLVVLGLVALTAVAQGRAALPVRGQVAQPPDPGAPGPYAVGVTRRGLTRPSSTTGEPRALDVLAWYPAEPAAAALRRPERLGAPPDVAPERAGQPYPVLMFSPGAGGEPDISTYFTTHLASHGFVVVATSHPGTTPAPCPFQSCAPLNSASPEARAWGQEAVANRTEDIRFVLESALALSAGGDPVLGGLLDPERIGMTGTSFGGGTALAVVAEDRRYRAVAAVAPAAALALPAAPRIAVPSLILAGGVDHLARPPQVEELLGALAAYTPERWFVGVARSGHSMLMDWCPDDYPECGDNAQPRPGLLPLSEAHARINRWTAAFLLRYVAGDARYAPLLDPALASGDPDLRVTVARAP